MLGQAIGLIWQVGRWLLVAIAVFTAAQAVLGPLQLVAIHGAVNAALAKHGLALWLLILVAALSLPSVIQPLASLLQAHLADRFTRLVRSRLLGQINSWPGIERFEDPQTLDDLEFASTHLAWAGPEMLHRILAMVAVLVSLIGSAVMLGTVSWPVMVLVLVAQVPGAITQWRFQNLIGSSFYVLTGEARQLRYARELAVSMDVAKDVRLRGMFDYLQHRYRSTFARVDATLGATERRQGGQQLAADLVRGVLVAGSALWLVSDLSAGAISVGSLTMGLAAIAMITGAAGSLAFQLGFLPIGLKVLPVLTRLLNLGPDLPVTPAGRTEVPEGPLAIAFEQVSFTYPGASTPTLNQVSFEVPAGQSLALVGHNGSGKTTIVKLLLRFHDVDSGRVLVDGTDVRQWDLAALRRATGALFQDYARWELTAAQNIGLGDLSRIDDQEAIQGAARAGNAADFIAALPEQYQTRLGADLGGRQLSGGQWQRLALSRATMSRARLLVLDEPTAELDPRAEAEVFDRYAELSTDRTIVLVSHRFSTVRAADRIVVLQDGRVIERGTHAELVATAGEYARLYRLQASQYVDLCPAGDQS